MIDISEICEILIYAGFPTGLFLGYRFGKLSRVHIPSGVQFINEKLEARILELNKQIETLSEKDDADHQCPCCGERMVDDEHVGEVID